MLIIRPISVLRFVAMVLVQMVVVLWSLVMPIEVLWSLMMSIEVQVALVRTRSGAVLCLLENRKMKKNCVVESKVGAWSAEEQRCEES